MDSQSGLKHTQKCSVHPTKSLGPNEIVIDKTFLNLLLEDTIVPHVHLEQMMKDNQGMQNLDSVVPELSNLGTKYQDAIQEIADNHINITTQAVEEAGKAGKDRYDFVQALEPEYDNILAKGGQGVDGLIADVYTAGKDAGFKGTDIDKFFSPADFQALDFTREYNFGLIKNMTDDLRRSIGDEVFAAKMRGDDMPTLAKAIAYLGINPIQAGGRMLSVPERSMLIARTETARASMQGNMIALQQQGVVSFDWMDSGNENECGDCEDNAAGSPYTAENLPDYPAHPDCCCNIAPSSVMGKQAQDGPVGSDNGPTDPGTILNLVSGSMNTVSGSATEDAGMDPKDLSDDAIAANTPKENKELMDRAEEALYQPRASPTLKSP